MLLLAAMLSLQTPPEAVRAAVELRLTSMESAALGGNAEAWIASIAPDDPTLTVEERHFADDLRNHPPLEFDLSIADDPPPVFTDQRADVTLVMHYRAPAGHAEKGKTASWPARFILQDPDGAGPLGADWLYAGEQWQGVSGRGFEVRYLPGGEQAAKEVLEAFPIAKAHDDEGFEINNQKHQVIKLYNDMEHLKATVYLTMPDEVLGGWNEPGESIKFMSNYTHGVDGWTAAMAHEYGHVATWELGPEVTKMPWWVQEGAAELAAEEFLPGSVDRLNEMLRAMAAAGTLPSFDEISDYRTTKAPLKIMAYHQGHHFLGYISVRWGRHQRHDWLAALARGDGLNYATHQAFGLSFPELEARWRDSLRPVREEAVGAIRARLGAMESAARAGDTAAYMANLAQGDDCFIQEQQRWAGELAVRTPKAFHLTIPEGESPVLTGDTAETDVTMSWRLLGRSGRADFRARFVHQGEDWLYAGEAWSVLDGHGVHILYGPGLADAAGQVVLAFPAIRAHVEEGLETSGPPVQNVKLFASMEHLQSSFYLAYASPLGGATDFDWIKLVASPRWYEDLSRSLAHEFAHSCLARMGPQTPDWPFWVGEGAAELAAEQYDPESQQRARSEVLALVSARTLPNFNQISYYQTMNPRLNLMPYRMGEDILGYISERWGRTSRNNWLKAMAGGSTLEQATEEALGLTFIELADAWRATLTDPSPAGGAK